MVSLKQKRQSGFTIVELLIVIIIIGILAGLVVTQILGANAKARDTERKTDLGNIANQLEAYYAKTGGYPTVANLADAAWRTGNELTAGDNAKSLFDPSATTTAISGTMPTTAMGAYTYVTLPASCVSPTDAAGDANTGTFCSSYTLTALLENSKDKDATSATVSGVTQYRYEKQSANQ